MKKTPTSARKVVAKNPAMAMTVKDARTGQDIVVHGFGAMADSGFKLKKNVSLLKPIAAQTLARSRKSKVS